MQWLRAAERQQRQTERQCSTKKLTAALNLLSTTGMWRSNYAPPLFRLLWRCNVRVAPPHFRSMRANAVTLGAYFGVVWTTAMWWIFWRGTIPAAVALGSGALAGLLFGLSMGAYYQRGRRKHDLPDWESLGDTWRPTPDA